MDILIVKPGLQKGVFGGLDDFALTAIEPPLWGAILAGYLRKLGYGVGIVDLEIDPLPDKIDTKLVMISVSGHNPSASTIYMDETIRLAAVIKQQNPEVRIILHGLHPSALPARTVIEPNIDFVCQGEGFETLPALIDMLREEGEIKSLPGLWYNPKGVFRIVGPNPPPLLDLSLLPMPAWDLLPMTKYRDHNWHCFDDIKNRSPYVAIYTSLGCSYNCLRGDTLINTIEGMIPIKDMVGRKTIKVLSRDPKTNNPEFVDAINIRKTRANAELVRVSFDDGTHIDCTPDHKFKIFKGGNGHTKTVEYDVEAKDLKPKQRVRAVKYRTNKYGYVDLEWGRRKAAKLHRVIMEGITGIVLTRKDVVHHLDKDKQNNHPSNLSLCNIHNHVPLFHPEISERMKKSNQSFGLPHEHFVELGKMQKGKVRSFEARVKYRLSKLGEKNPNYKDGTSTLENTGLESRLCVNHKIVRVDFLLFKEDVYCMEVPSHPWFYANNVLVHNCSFCNTNSLFGKSGIRYRPVSAVIDEIDFLVKNYGIRNIKIADELFCLKEDRVVAICNQIIERGYDLNMWAYARIDTITLLMLEKMKKAGFNLISYGIESGSKRVLQQAHKQYNPNSVMSVVKMTRDAGLIPQGNFIFGLPEDDFGSMQQTLEMAFAIETEWPNFYVAMAYPGSRLYTETDPSLLPAKWSGYSQYSYDCQPLPTKYLTPTEVLAFRDYAFHAYFENPKYLKMMQDKFGTSVVSHIKNMTKIKLKRKLLGD